MREQPIGDGLYSERYGRTFSFGEIRLAFDLYRNYMWRQKHEAEVDDIDALLANRGETQTKLLDRILGYAQFEQEFRHETVFIWFGDEKTHEMLTTTVRLTKEQARVLRSLAAQGDLTLDDLAAAAIHALLEGKGPS